MFGYIVANQPELKVRELQVYRSYYCGICHSIKNRYGQFSRLSLNYDLTFVAVLLSSLDLKDPSCTQKRCLLHPLTLHQLRQDAYTDYAADMTIFLAYYKCLDDWKDDKNKKAFFYQQILKRKVRKVIKKFPHKTSVIENCLKEINALESAQSKDIDKLSSLFGKIMAEIMTFQNERWQSTLSEIGMHLGKFIYLMDACEDLEEDLKTIHLMSSLLIKIIQILKSGFMTFLNYKWLKCVMHWMNSPLLIIKNYLKTYYIQVYGQSTQPCTKERRRYKWTHIRYLVFPAMQQMPKSKKHTGR